MIYDNCGRPLTSMRISITSRCNLNCIYCHHEGITRNTGIEMTPEEIEEIVRISTEFGVRKVKITGGEPLLRKDIVSIVKKISDVSGVEDVSLTTNAMFLEKLAKELKIAGLNRINISIDTLKSKVFSEITQGGNLSTVQRGIEKAIEVGLKPVKLNMVIMKGINNREIHNMLKKYSRDNVVVQLIELVDSNELFFEKYYYSLDEVEDNFERRAKEIVVRKLMHGRHKYILNGTEVEVIKPMHNTDFCAHCTRIRVTADGKFKPCLMRDDNLVNFLDEMRLGADKNRLKELFKKAIGEREPFFKQNLVGSN